MGYSSYLVNCPVRPYAIKQSVLYCLYFLWYCACETFLVGNDWNRIIPSTSLVFIVYMYAFCKSSSVIMHKKLGKSHFVNYVCFFKSCGVVLNLLHKVLHCVLCIDRGSAVCRIFFKGGVITIGCRQWCRTSPEKVAERRRDFWRKKIFLKKIPRTLGRGILIYIVSVISNRHKPQFFRILLFCIFWKHMFESTNWQNFES